MRKVIYLLLLIILSGCSTQSIHDIYHEAIIGAMTPDSSKIYQNLTDINLTNKNLIWKEIDGEKYLLCVTWKEKISKYENYVDSTYYNSGKSDIWVTISPELLNKLQVENFNDRDLRIKQLLGLPPTSNYNYFVEFWVKPDDLFRPCADSEINDSECELCFPGNTDSTHIFWINDYRIESYYQCELYDKYPWTQLGYTYDWNPKNKSNIGLSEFVIKQNSKVKINNICTTDEYLNNE